MKYLVNKISKLLKDIYLINPTKAIPYMSRLCFLKIMQFNIISILTVVILQSPHQVRLINVNLNYISLWPSLTHNRAEKPLVRGS